MAVTPVEGYSLTCDSDGCESNAIIQTGNPLPKGWSIVTIRLGQSFGPTDVTEQAACSKDCGYDIVSDAYAVEFKRQVAKR